MAEHRRAATEATAEESKDSMEFAKKVRAWLDEASAKVTELLDQAGTSAHGVDEEAKIALRTVGRAIENGRGDLGSQIPVEE